MCEIFGGSFRDEYYLNDYLNVFYSHSDNHPHGWGLACFEGKDAFIEKEPVQATKSKYLKSRLTVPISFKNALAHIRYATIGNIEYTNCHPYTAKDSSGRRWTMVHNGTIFNYSPLDKFFHLQKGDTDSERILLYIVEEINKAQKELERPLTSKERFNKLDEIVSSMSSNNKLNLLIFDGHYIYVHTNCKNTLYYLEKKEGVIISTRPLSSENWQNVPFTTLLAYKEGKLKYTGTNHQNEFIENEESMKFLYQIFSDL